MALRTPSLAAYGPLGHVCEPAYAKKNKRGHEGIEPSTSPTLKEKHTTRPMARAQTGSGTHDRRLYPFSVDGSAGMLRVSTGRAFRAPLAERSAVNRQVLGSIPSAGVLHGDPIADRG